MGRGLIACVGAALVGAARMVWQDQTAKRLSRAGSGSNWLLGRGAGSRDSSGLVAKSSGGVVRRLSIEEA